jgi:hypothetical protein
VRVCALPKRFLLKTLILVPMPVKNALSGCSAKTVAPALSRSEEPGCDAVGAGAAPGACKKEKEDAVSAKQKLVPILQGVQQLYLER